MTEDLQRLESDAWNKIEAVKNVSVAENKKTDV
jgi:hypothetical protein